MAPDDRDDDPPPSAPGDPPLDAVRVRELLDWAGAKQHGAATDADAPELDEATRASLERWFGLPSALAVEDRGDIAGAADGPADDLPSDPAIRARLEARARALAAVDPALLEAHRARVESDHDLLRFSATIDVRVDPSIARFDATTLARVMANAEPREVEISDDLRDALSERTPQALLRDLHRADKQFDYHLEVDPSIAGERANFDAASVAQEAMRVDHRLPPTVDVTRECVELSAELRRLRSIPTSDIPTPRRRT